MSAFRRGILVVCFHISGLSVFFLLCYPRCGILVEKCFMAKESAV